MKRLAFLITLIISWHCLPPIEENWGRVSIQTDPSVEVRETLPLLNNSPPVYYYYSQGRYFVPKNVPCRNSPRCIGGT